MVQDMRSCGCGATMDDKFRGWWGQGSTAVEHTYQSDRRPDDDKEGEMLSLSRIMSIMSGEEGDADRSWELPVRVMEEGRDEDEEGGGR